MSRSELRVTHCYSPLRSLEDGHWFKLICGASFQSLPDVRSLTLSYALAGADCIDVAADPAVVAAAREGLAAFWRLYSRGKPVTVDAPGTSRFLALGQGGDRPWLMVSLNDGDDPHFRKATFAPAHCPADCPRPCETICPADAIRFGSRPEQSGVIESRCYGCGRCLPVCPIQQIETRSLRASPDAVMADVLPQVDALEIHTQVGRLQDFTQLWRAIAPACQTLKVLAISCPDGDGLIEYLQALHRVITPLPCPVIWQTDGRPMSGDIGKGVTHATIRLGQKVLAANLPGYVQLAGGTNAYTVPKLRELGLLNTVSRSLPSSFNEVIPPSAAPRFINGVAYGSFARVLLAPILQDLSDRQLHCSSALPTPVVETPLIPTSGSAQGAKEWAWHGRSTESSSSPTATELKPPTVLPPPTAQHLEDFPDLLHQAVQLATSLVSPLKSHIHTSAS
ncbi:MAG: LdpA C-terminal domain-containing domain [Cyanobacteria bacterium J06638_20]